MSVFLLFEWVLDNLSFTKRVTHVVRGKMTLYKARKFVKYTVTGPN